MSTQQVSLDTDKLFIGGDWVPSRGTGRIEIVSPSTEEHVGSVPEGTEADIDVSVAAARRTFEDPTGWSSWSPADRADVLERLADALEARGEETAHRVSMQNGMPISIALELEAVFPAMLARYYAGLIRSTKLEEQRRRSARWDDPGRSQAGRRDRSDRAVELSADAGHVQARAGDRDGLHDGR